MKPVKLGLANVVDQAFAVILKAVVSQGQIAKAGQAIVVEQGKRAQQGPVIGAAAIVQVDIPVEVSGAVLTTVRCRDCPLRQQV